MSGAGVSRCCCGCSLRHGTIAIGYFYTITGVLTSTVCFTALYILETGNKATSTHVDSSLPKEMTIFLISYGVMGIIQMVVSVVLVYGVYKGRPGYLMPWIVYASICYVLGKITIIICIVSLSSRNRSASVIIICTALFPTVLFAYFLVVVCSHRKSLQENCKSGNTQYERVLKV